MEVALVDRVKGLVYVESQEQRWQPLRMHDRIHFFLH